MTAQPSRRAGGRTARLTARTAPLAKNTCAQYAQASLVGDTNR